jgi:hypothetical protein
MIGSWEEEYKDLSAVSFSGIGCGGRSFGQGGISGDARGSGEVKTRTLNTSKGSAPREFQLCLKLTPVPRGGIGHPPSIACADCLQKKEEAER